jgi:hypothetical protein
MVRRVNGISGFSLTSATDATVYGEGITTEFGEHKVGSIEVLRDGWNNLRWCISLERTHIYDTGILELEVVLSNFGVLRDDRTYPVTLRITGAEGTVWSQTITVAPQRAADGRIPFVIPVFDGKLNLPLHEGEYAVTAEFTEGAYAASGQKTFWVTSRSRHQRLDGIRVMTLDTHPSVERLLSSRGAHVTEYMAGEVTPGTVVFIGIPGALAQETADSLYAAAGAGAHVVFLNAAAARLNELPFAGRASHTAVHPRNWLYHYDGFIYGSSVMTGLQTRQVLDPEFYEDVFSDMYITGIIPDDISVTTFLIGSNAVTYTGTVSHGFQLGTFNHGDGFVTLNMLRLSETGTPAADRILVNLAAYGRSE